MNIPIYRAKKIDSDEYVTGTVSVLWDYIDRETEDLNENELDEPIRRVVICGAYDNYSGGDGWNFRSDFIDESTLSIHFEDMLDSQGNKIFASLSEDGKGGDIITSENGNETVKFTKLEGYETYQGGQDKILFYGVKIGSYSLNVEHMKVIGIQK